MMNPAQNPAAASERIPPKRLFAFLIMVFGMFMSILDIQIVSASLNEIQAGLSASQSEVSWVQTSYLIAEVIAIPLSGFMSRALGTRPPPVPVPRGSPPWTTQSSTRWNFANVLRFRASVPA